MVLVNTKCDMYVAFCQMWALLTVQKGFAGHGILR
jgi:hypothetical protein